MGEETQLRLSDCRALIVYDEDPDLESVALETQIQNILKEAEKINEDYEQTCMQSAYLTLNLNKDPRAKRLFRRMLRLQAEVEALQTGQPVRYPSMGDEDEKPKPQEPKPETETDEDGPNFTVEDQRRRKKLLNRILSRELKDLVRKLNTICHPDKTSDKNLRELYPLILMMRDREDLNGLKHVMVEVQEYLKAKKSNKHRKGVLLSSLERARQVLQDAQRRAASSDNEIGHVLLKMKNEGREYEVLPEYCRFLENVGDKLMAQKVHLEFQVPLRSFTAHTVYTSTGNW